METIDLSRRRFLELSGVAAGSLVVAFYLPSGLQKAFAQKPTAPPFPNAFIVIAPDNSVTFVINKLEMGQGVNTSMAQLIAEELDCDWDKVRSVSAGVDPVYNHTMMGPMQLTGGSTALISSWDQHRKIGASLREMLKTAAATRWGVSVNELKTSKGYVTHARKGKISYGELVGEAQKLPVPENPPLKNAKDYKIIGKSTLRVDAPEKSNGTAIFGMDVRIPGMLYAVIARPSVNLTKAASYNKKAAKAIKGVVDVIELPNGVAVLATNTHSAKKGRDALKIQWKDKAYSKISSTSLMADFKKQSKSKSSVKVADRGDAVNALKGATQKIEAEYTFPFLAHAAMEPMNCTINYDGQSAELWSGHQMPTGDRMVASQILGLAPEKIKVNTVYAGGSFGRRASKTSDYVTEACWLAKKVKKPLKVVWTREDDMRGGYYRPMNYHRVTVGFNDQNELLGWDHSIVGQSIAKGSPFEKMMFKNGVDPLVIEGVNDTHYSFPHFRCHQVIADTPYTTLWWRSVGHTHTAYVMETMMDELAHTMKRDPLELRQSLLKDQPRHLAVLDLLKQKSGWGSQKPPAGRAWGLALHESFNSVVGHVAEVSIKDNVPRIHKIWSAVHCGTVVNPEGAKTQVEGAIVYGLSAAMMEEIKIDKGHVLTGNFNDFPVMRIQDMPVVDVSFVPSNEKPTGLGEPGLPPIAPAVANAIFQLTQKRLRHLPFSKELQG
ncbi:MAG: xanthine dehydrogenase family protein molybdopterin-binding subunit [Bdellovibrionales bacterium]|nr:xanthine dehydrogenase family protein molybdopterin-binding subunit [Bdellovibrionales bacterium]